MVLHIARKDFLTNLLSARFLIGFVLCLVLIPFSILINISNYRDRVVQYRVDRDVAEKAAAEVRVYSTLRPEVVVPPEPLSVFGKGLSDQVGNRVKVWLGEKPLLAAGKTVTGDNPFLASFFSVDFVDIAAIIFSLLAFIFSYDAFTREKEDGTLKLQMSNSLGRSTCLAGKLLGVFFTLLPVLAFSFLLSAVMSVTTIVLAGVLTSLIVILLLGGTAFSSALAGELLGFLAVAALLAATFATFGLFSSVIAPSSNVSLLLALSFWLAFVVVVPNSSTFVAKTFFPIASSEIVQKNVNAAFADLSKSAPEGSWMMNSRNPFLPQHELRANLQMKRLQAERDLRDAHYRTMFRQFERTRLVTSLSPVSVFEYLTEAAAGGGYPRFRKVWEDMHVYQSQFLEFFKALDATDKDSPHWYNPSENVSTTRKPVAFEKVPQFEEGQLSAADRVAPALKYLVINVFTVSAIFFLTFVLFVRYDVR